MYPESAFRPKKRKMMIDLHAHILPGLDDGAQNAQETVLMAAIAAESGVGVIAATPHSFGNECFGGEFRTSVLSAIGYAQNEINAREIPITLVPGMEIYATPETAELLASGDLLTINGTKYALIEFAFGEKPRAIYDMLRPVLDMGYVPLVAHPERYSCICENIKVAQELVAHGCLLQVNKGSLLGSFGSEIMRTAMLLIKQELAFCVASDGHSIQRRNTDLYEARQTISDLFSAETAERLLCRNPEKILKSPPFAVEADGSDIPEGE